jgi:hypothetical protein
MQRKTLIPRKKFIARDPLAPAQAAHLRYVTGEGPGFIANGREKAFLTLDPA